MLEKIDYPIRINRYLFLKGYCSRREADRLIEKKQIKINGKLAVIGQKINEEDKIELNKSDKKLVYLMFNKPKGIVSHDPQSGQKSIENILNYPEKVFPLGRLDKDSRGLILLSNDGRITDALLNPKHEHEKEYEVEVNNRIDLNFIKQMEKGVKISNYKTKPCKIKKIEPRKFQIILTEGKKHQIRRMCASLKQEVLDLKRIRIMDLKLGNLKEGQWKELKGLELKKLLNNLLGSQ